MMTTTTTTNQVNIASNPGEMIDGVVELPNDLETNTLLETEKRKVTDVAAEVDKDLFDLKPYSGPKKLFLSKALASQ